LDGYKLRFKSTQITEEKIHDLIETKRADEQESTPRGIFKGATKEEQNIYKGGDVDQERTQHESEGEPDLHSLSDHDRFLVVVNFLTVVLHEHVFLLVASDSGNTLKNFGESADNGTLGDAFQTGKILGGFGVVHSQKMANNEIHKNDGPEHIDWRHDTDNDDVGSQEECKHTRVTKIIGNVEID